MSTLTAACTVAPGRLVAAYCDGRVLLCTKDGQRALVYAGGSQISALAYDRISNRLAIGDSRGAVVIVTIDGQDVPTRIPGAHGRHVSALAFSGDGKQLASTSPDNQVRIWTICGKSVATWPGVGGTAEALHFQDERWILAAGFVDGSVRLWDVAARDQLNSWEGVRHHALLLAWHPAGSHLAIINRARGLWLWNLRASRQHHIGDLPSHAEGLCFASDSGILKCVPKEDGLLPMLARDFLVWQDESTESMDVAS